MGPEYNEIVDKVFQDANKRTRLLHEKTGEQDYRAGGQSELQSHRVTSHILYLATRFMVILVI